MNVVNPPGTERNAQQVKSTGSNGNRLRVVRGRVEETEKEEHRRKQQDFYTADLVSDLLSGGDSSRLYKHLVQEQRLLASVNAYISGDVDPGLFVFTGQLLPDTTPEQAEAAFRAEIEALQSVPASDYEVEKVKNKFEANTLFGELNVMNKAMNLGFYEMLGDLPLINGEVAAYRAVTTGDILAFSRRTFRPENCSILIYKAKK